MKKGCFIKMIIILTIFTAAVVYIIQNKFDEFVLNPGKKFLKEFTEEQINQELSHIKPSAEKDSLINITKDFFGNSAISKDFSPEKIDKIEEEFELVIRDSIIQPDELQKLKLLIGKR
jgi:hypothetical protein